MSRIVVIEVFGGSPTELLQNPTLESVAYLASQGCHGALVGAGLWALLGPHLNAAAPLGAEGHAPSETLAALAAALRSGPQDARAAVMSQGSDLARAIEDALPAVLGALAEDDVLALVAYGVNADAAFVLAARAVVPGSLPDSASPGDLALTLLALAGRACPDALKPYRVLVSPADASDEDDEAALRERFRGLGYVL